MSNYFKEMPVVLYDFTIQGDASPKHLTMVDVSTRVVLKMSGTTEDQITDQHEIKEWDTPQSLSEQFYGTSDYYWLFMYMNDLADINNDWPMAEFELKEFCKKKYPGLVKDYQPTSVISLYVNSLSTNSYVVTVDPGYIAQLPRVIWGSFLEASNILARDTEIVSISGNAITLNKYPLVVTDENTGIPVTVVPKVEGYLGLHHYENDVGAVCDKTYTNGSTSSVGAVDDNAVYVLSQFDASFISNYDYEHRINEGKRIIKYIKPEYLSEFLGKYKVEIAG